ncbi:MAG: hypothetical protein ACJAYE_003273 [Candidatus Azotimanducaceae bacterium]|jgi:hypothetical protein
MMIEPERMTIRFLALALACFLSACSDNTTTVATTDAPSSNAKNLQSAEAIIDAFYTFDPDALAPLLDGAKESAAPLLFYQGWAEGGNYKIISRAPCVAETENTISCGITVEDDPVLALKLDFKVTDTFTITFDGDKVTAVETSSNDKPIYGQAYEWVVKESPEVMTGPCLGFFDDGPTPGDCVRAMTEGYHRFAASDAFPTTD